jgi:hypothetical protein
MKEKSIPLEHILLDRTEDHISWIVDKALPLTERRVVDWDIMGKPIYSDQLPKYTK